MSIINKSKAATPSDWLSTGLSTEEINETKKLALIASKIQLKRLQMKMSQKDFAKYMGVSQGMVSRWESGEYNFTITTLNDICNRLGLNLSLSITEIAGKAASALTAPVPSPAILQTSALSETQALEVAQLAEDCCRHENIRLSYPTDESGEGCCHYLIYKEDGTLVAALAMLLLDDGLAECCAFTHPGYRRQGYFSRLLDAAMESHDECNILFAVSEACRDAMAVLSSLDAELESWEHQMELELPHGSSSTDSGSLFGLLHHTGLHLSSDNAHPQTTWTLYADNTPVGHCLTTSTSATSVCLHHLEIGAALRGRGYGSVFLTLLLPHLSASGIHKVLLQVSGDNEAAIALYKKTGFRITETLSYYCY